MRTDFFQPNVRITSLNTVGEHAGCINALLLAPCSKADGRSIEASILRKAASGCVQPPQ